MRIKRVRLVLSVFLVVIFLNIKGMSDCVGDLVREQAINCLDGLVAAPVIPKSYFLMAAGGVGAVPVAYVMGKKIAHVCTVTNCIKAVAEVKAGIEFLTHAINHKDEVDQTETPFFEYAVKEGLVDPVQSALELHKHKHKKWKSSTICNAATCVQSKAMLTLLVEHGVQLQYQELAFYAAVKKGNSDTVKLFLDAGIALDKRAFKSPGWTVVDIAAYYGHSEIVSQLLEKGARPNPLIVDYISKRDVFNLLANQGVIDKNKLESQLL